MSELMITRAGTGLNYETDAAITFNPVSSELQENQKKKRQLVARNLNSEFSWVEKRREAKRVLVQNWPRYPHVGWVLITLIVYLSRVFIIIIPDRICHLFNLGTTGKPLRFVVVTNELFFTDICHAIPYSAAPLKRGSAG